MNRWNATLFSLLLLFDLINAQYRCDWNVFDASGTLTGTNFNSFIGFWQIEPQIGIQEEPDMMAQINRLVTKLYNPQPNPFSHKTQIMFSLRNAGLVKLSIFDLSGRIVKTLMNGNLKPDIYTISWQGEDKSGKRLAQGVYFLKFQSDDYQKITKILLIQ